MNEIGNSAMKGSREKLLSLWKNIFEENMKYYQERENDRKSHNETVTYNYLVPQFRFFPWRVIVQLTLMVLSLIAFLV